MSATHSFASFQGIVRMLNEIFRKAEPTSKAFIMKRWLMVIVSFGNNLCAETSNKNNIKRKVTFWRGFTFEFTREHHGNSRYRSIWEECSSEYQVFAMIPVTPVIKCSNPTAHQKMIRHHRHSHLTQWSIYPVIHQSHQCSIILRIAELLSSINFHYSGDSFSSIHIHQMRLELFLTHHKPLQSEGRNEHALGEPQTLRRCGCVYRETFI